MKDVKVALSKTRSLLIALPELITLDTAVAAKLLTELLTVHLNKPTKLLLPQNYKLTSRITDFLGFEKFPDEIVEHQILPESYTLTIPGIEKGTDVEWQLENSKLEIKLKPKSTKIDFSKLAFGVEGDRYGAIATLGAQNTQMLNSAYQASKEALTNTTTINLDFHPKNESFGTINIIDEKASSLTELVFALYKEIGAKLDKQSADLAKKTITVSTDGLRRIASSKTLGALIELEGLAENDVSEVVNTHYHSLGKKGLALRETLIKNARFENNNRLLWSYLTSEQLQAMDIDPSVLDGIEQFPYNICKDVQVAVLLYQKQDFWQCVAISNDRSICLFNWAKTINAKSTSYIAVAEIKGDFETASRTAIMTLQKEALGETSQVISIKPISTTPVKTEKESEVQDKQIKDEKPFKSAAQEDVKKVIHSGFSSPQSPFEKAPQGS